jgi:putative hydrolase of the HAD superfamily
VGTVPAMARPEAVLLDVGGIFLLPDPERVLGAFARSECKVPPDLLADAHYRAAAQFTTDLDLEADWQGSWRRYLEVYVEACDVPEELRDEVHAHVDSEFADAGLWVEPIPACREHLETLAATGVQLGIVSNADGLIGERLRQMEILQVGPGLGVEVACVIDSGDVGVMKPDPRIFRIALEALGVEPEQAWYIGDMPAFDVVGARAAGLRAFVIDPLGLHGAADYDAVASLSELAELVEAA